LIGLIQLNVLIELFFSKRNQPLSHSS